MPNSSNPDGHPLDPRYFRITRLRVGASVITIAFFGMFGMFFVVSQYFQFVKGYSPMKTDLATLPSAVTMIIVAPRAVLVQQRITVRRTIALGLASIALGMATFAFFLRDDSSYLVPLIGIVFVTAGVGCAMPSSTTSIMTSLPMNKAGVGSAVNDTTREVGGALGIAVVGSVLASVYRVHQRPQPGPRHLGRARIDHGVRGAARVPPRHRTRPPSRDARRPLRPAETR